MSIGPRAHFALLLEHVSTLVLLHDAGWLGEDALHAAIGGGAQTDATRSAIERLDEARIIEPRSGLGIAWQLTSATRSYMSNVLQRGQIQSPDTVAGMVAGISRKLAYVATLFEEQRIDEAVEETGEVVIAIDALRDVANRLGEAVVRRANDLKGLNIPTRERFRRILRMWEDVVLPLYEHVSPDGYIETTLSACADRMNALATHPPHREAAPHAHMLVGAIRRARRAASDSFNEAYGEIIRLYEDPRRRERIEIGVQLLLDQLMTGGVAALALHDTMRITTFRFTSLMNDENAASVVHGVANAGDNVPVPAFDRAALVRTAQPTPRPMTLPDASDDAMGDVIARARLEGRSLADVIEAYGRVLSRRDRRTAGTRTASRLGDVEIETPRITLGRSGTRP